MHENESSEPASSERPVGRRKGELSLSLPAGLPWRRPLLWGGVGFLAAGLFVAASISVWLLPIALLGCLALPLVVVRLRMPHEASVSWDEWGITERVDGHVRAAIAWREARVLLTTRGAGRILQLTDEAGRTITLAEPSAVPAWLARRRAVVSSLDALAAATASLAKGPSLRPDARDARRPTMGWQVAALTWALALLGGVTMLLVPEMRRLVPAFLALMTSLLFAAAALRPLHELLALLAEARQFERAEEATIESGEEQEALLRIREREWLRVELASARHPDRLLATRQGTALRVVLPRSGVAASPSRSSVGAPVVVEAVETTAEQEEREVLLRAALLELAARGAGALCWGALSLMPIFR